MISYHGYTGKDVISPAISGSFAECYSEVRAARTWCIERLTVEPIGDGACFNVILAQSRTDAPGTMAAWYRAQQEAK